MTADQLLDKLAREGGVIVSSGMMTTAGIAQAQACGRFYVNQDHLGFAHLPNCMAHPKDLPIQVASREVIDAFVAHNAVMLEALFAKDGPDPTASADRLGRAIDALDALTR